MPTDRPAPRRLATPAATLASAMLAFVAAAPGDAAGAGDTAVRDLRAVWPGAAVNVVVDEGAAEPRSIGSYAVRVYDGRSGAGDHDAYLTGIVRPRDGTLSKVDFADLDADGVVELVVVTQSAGSGGYLAADAFRLRHGVIARVAGVEGLAPSADPVAALRKAAAR